MKLIKKYGVLNYNNYATTGLINQSPNYKIVMMEASKENWSLFGYDDPEKITALDINSIILHMQEHYYAPDIGFGLGFPEPNGGAIVLSKQQVDLLNTVSPKRQQEVLTSCIKYVETIHALKEN